MKDFNHQARNFFTEEEYAQFIEETKTLLAHKQEPQPDTAPLSFMLFMHDIYGVSREEMEIVDGEVLLTLKAGKRIAQQRLRDSDINPEQQDQIIELLRIIGSHEK
jgi:hypothetical protein